METIPQLRPLGFVDLLDAAFRLYRKHFLTFIGIVALLQVPLAILQLLVQVGLGNSFMRKWTSVIGSIATTPSPSNPFEALLSADVLAYIAIILGLWVLQWLIVFNILSGALANAISRSYRGETVSILEAYHIARGKYLALIGASLITILLSSLLLGLIFACSAGSVTLLTMSANRSNNVISVIAFILVLFLIFCLVSVVSLYVTTRLVVAAQAIVIENNGAWAGLKRSWSLVKYSFWRVLGLIVLLAILNYILTSLPAAIVSFMISLLTANSIDYLALNQAIVTLLTYMGIIISLPLQFIVYTLLYYDLRVRKEGYDLELRAQAIH